MLVNDDYLLNLHIDPYPPPNDITLTKLGAHDALYNYSTEMFFEWSPVIINCPTLYYDISSNCGLCPNTSHTEPTATCSAHISELSGGQCTFEVKTGVCNDLLGATDMIQLTLTGTKENC